MTPTQELLPEDIMLIIAIVILAVIIIMGFLLHRGDQMYMRVFRKKEKELEELLEKKRVNIYKVEIGMRMDEVEALMGKTEFKRMYKHKDRTTHEWKYYLDEHTNAYIEFDKLNLVNKVAVI